MPVVLPVIAAIGTVAAGVGAAAAATTVIGTVAAYATIAGGVLTGIGALTGKKDLMKVGTILSIGGGLATAASNLANAAADAATSAASDIATDVASDVAGDFASSAFQEGAKEFVSTAASDIAKDAIASSGSIATPAIAAPNAVAGAGGAVSGATPAVSTVAQAAQPAVAPTVTVGGIASAAPSTATSPLQQWLDKITGVGKGVVDTAGKVGTFVKDNKDLVQLGGQMLSSAYGPQAEQLDMQKSIYNRQQQNLNTPIRLYYKRGG